MCSIAIAKSIYFLVKYIVLEETYSLQIVKDFYFLAPHIGHLYTALLADAAQRFQQLLGDKEVLFMTGTDEHGSKIQQAAQKVNSPPQDYCDMISEQFKELFQQFDINYTHFIRTTNEGHINAVHKFWVSV